MVRLCRRLTQERNGIGEFRHSVDCDGRIWRHPWQEVVQRRACEILGWDLGRVTQVAGNEKLSWGKLHDPCMQREGVEPLNARVRHVQRLHHFGPVWWNRGTNEGDVCHIGRLVEATEKNLEQFPRHGSPDDRAELQLDVLWSCGGHSSRDFW